MVGRGKLSFGHARFKSMMSCTHAPLTIGLLDHDYVGQPFRVINFSDDPNLEKFINLDLDCMLPILCKIPLLLLDGFPVWIDVQMTRWHLGQFLGPHQHWTWRCLCFLYEHYQLFLLLRWKGCVFVCHLVRSLPICTDWRSSFGFTFWSLETLSCFSPVSLLTSVIKTSIIMLSPLPLI